MAGQEPNKTNIIYFECSSMRDLYDAMRSWQDTNQKGFLSVSIQQDNGYFCCIALIHPITFEQQMPDPLTKVYKDEMARYERKALKHIGVRISFVSDVIPSEKILVIQSKLEKCATTEEVRAVFMEEF